MGQGHDVLVPQIRFPETILNTSSFADCFYGRIDTTATTFGGLVQHHCVAQQLPVDGEEIVASRAISGNTDFHTNSICIPIALTAGTHTVEVLYRTPGSFVNVGFADWNGATLKVVLMGDAAPQAPPNYSTTQ